MVVLVVDVGVVIVHRDLRNDEMRRSTNPPLFQSLTPLSLNPQPSNLIPLIPARPSSLLLTLCEGVFESGEINASVCTVEVEPNSVPCLPMRAYRWETTSARTDAHGQFYRRVSKVDFIRYVIYLNV